MTTPAILVHNYYIEAKVHEQVLYNTNSIMTTNTILTTITNTTWFVTIFSIPTSDRAREAIFISCVFSRYQGFYKWRMVSSVHAYWYRAYSIWFVAAPRSRFDKTNTPKRYLRADENNCSIDNRVCNWGKRCNRVSSAPRDLTLYAPWQQHVSYPHRRFAADLQCIAEMRVSACLFQSHPNSAENAHNLPVLLSVKEVRTEYMSKEYIQFRCKDRWPSIPD